MTVNICLQLPFGFVTFGASLVQEFDETRTLVVKQRIARRRVNIMRSSLTFSRFS
jgi:hypothetical protein